MKIFGQVLVFLFHMNTIYLILVTEFVFVRGGYNHDAKSPEPDASCLHHTTAQQNNYQTPALDHVKIGITSDNVVIQHVNLRQTNRALANENLPIWILKSVVTTGELHLHRNYEVMNQLGKFTFYQEAKTSSAAVYFHKRREFDGMIGYEFLIQKLSVNKIHPTDETSLPLKKHCVYRRPDYEGHGFENFDSDAGNTVGVNYQEHMKTYEGHIYDGYPEVLVIISWDVANHWTRNVEEPNHHTTIVSHVLTLFNGVDMLYSKLENTNVQINIAGIIIGMREHTFDFLQQCYRPQMRGNKRVANKLEGPCVNYILTRVLHAHKNEIPLDSYDSIIYLTRKKLFRMIRDIATGAIKNTKLVIGTSQSIHDVCHSKKRGDHITPIASITTKRYLDNYHGIAHELAHLMTVLHDAAPYFTEDDTCSGHLMRPNSNCCINCLSWSEMSETTFKLFFSSPNCCSFINEPLSLHPSGRQQKLTADEQCRCYGYESAKVFKTVPEDFCRVTLQCKGADNLFQDTVVPMDGTPCDNDKVCWQMNCQDIQIHKYPNQLH